MIMFVLLSSSSPPSCPSIQTSPHLLFTHSIASRPERRWFNWRAADHEPQPLYQCGRGSHSRYRHPVGRRGHAHAADLGFLRVPLWIWAAAAGVNSRGGKWGGVHWAVTNSHSFLYNLHIDLGRFDPTTLFLPTHFRSTPQLRPLWMR